MNGEPLQKLLRMVHLWGVVLIINIELLYSPYWPHDDNDSYHLLSTYVVPSDILRTVHSSSHLSFKIILWGAVLLLLLFFQMRKLITKSSVTSPKITPFVCGKNQVLTKIKYPYNAMSSCLWWILATGENIISEPWAERVGHLLKDRQTDRQTWGLKKPH